MTTLLLTEEQQMLKTAAHEFFREQSPVSALRRLRDEKDLLGYDPFVWSEMANMGWIGLIFPERYGGLEFGFAGMGALFEESGRFLVTSPLFSTAILGGMTLLLAGSEEQKAALLSPAVQGELRLALALEESALHCLEQTATQALWKDGCYVLSGRKVFVLDGHVADYLLIPARTSGVSGDPTGMSLFLVSRENPGLRIQRSVLVDSRNAATVFLEETVVGKEDLVGEEGAAWPVLQEVLDTAEIALASELLGVMQEAFERTMAYLRTRKQFGVPIGSFQALQHRAAIMYGEVELCKSLVSKALVAIDQKSEEVPLLASAAKAKTCQVAKQVTTEAIQMFGGIGMTDDEEIGFFLKRAKAIQQTLGSYQYHLDRLARLQGY